MEIIKNKKKWPDDISLFPSAQSKGTQKLMLAFLSWKALLRKKDKGQNNRNVSSTARTFLEGYAASNKKYKQKILIFSILGK